MSQIELGFIPEPLTISFDNLLQSRKLSDSIISSNKYQQILKSISTIGLIEPLSISAPNSTGKYVLLDGHIRVIAMKELGLIEAQCLIAKDDETYTYNNRVNRLSTVQEHIMIKRAITRGVSPDKLSASLNIDLNHLRRKVKLLDGICSEAVNMLKYQVFSSKISDVLRKMKPVRQVECVELMISANNITIPYIEALLAASPAQLLVKEAKPKKLSGVSAEQMLKMEREMSNLQDQYKLIEETYGQDVLNLVLAKGYLSKLLNNAEVSRYIKNSQPEVFSQFISIVEAVSLDK